MHMLDQTNGLTRMAYAVGEKPWHGLGFEVDPNDPPEVWREKANMTWENVKVPALYRWGSTVPSETRFSDQFFIVRNDTGDVLSPRTVSKEYHVHSIANIVKFMSDLCAEAGYQMETLISLHNGRKITALAKASADTIVGKNTLTYKQDVIQNYVLITTSFDGSLRTAITITRVRVVCWNTLQQALGEGQEVLRISHRGEFVPEDVHAQLGFIEKSHEPFVERASAMAEIRMDDDTREDFFLRVVSDNTVNADTFKELEKDEKKIIASRTNRLIYYHNKVGSGSNTAGNLLTAKETLWGAVNDVTGLYDHGGTPKAREGRFASATFGSRRKVKDLAWELALNTLKKAA